MPPPDCTAIIVASGASQRMGFDKLLWPLDGTPVLLRSIRAFLAAESVESIVVVCPQDRWDALDTTGFTKPVIRVDGGDSRQESVALGLVACPDTPLVAVHDGARPLVSPDDIEAAINAARDHQAASLARRATETIKRANAKLLTTESLSRDNLWFMETPQVFLTTLLLDAYVTVASDTLVVTDEVSALEVLGQATQLVESRHPNLKITSPTDLTLAEALVRQSPTP